jgi:CheY-like chemotaxis protein
MKYSEVEVLLIEDNPHEAQLALRCFRKYDLGARLMHIDDGIDALDFIFIRGKYEGTRTNEALKVIFLDLKMPKIDGLEVLRQLKTDERTRTIPVVVLTSSREETDIQNAYRLGANSFMVKPVDFDTFNTVISDLARYWILTNESPSLVKKGEK